MRHSILSCALGLLALSAGCGGETPAPAGPPPAASSAVSGASSGEPVPANAPPATAVVDAGAAPQPAPVAWGYTGDVGPERWGDLQTEFSLCKSGKAQAPIDLPSKADKGPGLKALAFEYPTISLALLNNGHTVQVPSTGAGSVAEGADKWDLVQFHLHAPSEHTLDGKRYDAEIHFVHKNAKGELAVVGVLVRKGKENKLLKGFFDNAPAEAGTDPKPVAGATVDLKAILPAQTGYFTYSGSLTAPPCSEGVTWFVLKTPVEASAEQLAKFHEVTHGDTSRPVQPLGERKVLRY
jgi:carbonic anhydrase